MWEKEIYKGEVLFGAPRAPCFPSRGKPITVKHTWPDVQLPRADPSVGAGHSPTMVPPVPDTPGVPLAANQDKRGRAASMGSTESWAGLPQTPKVSPRVIPHSWGCASS